MRFWTADFHFSHPSIIRYCNRPFKNVDRMAEVFIQRANERAKNRNDVIIHVGDFCCWGNERGVMGSKIKPIDYIDKFIATIVLLEGNHDSNNRVKSHIKSALINLGKTYTNVSVGHYPSYYKEAFGTFNPGTLRICGHVHGHRAWKWYWDSKNQVLNINVGVDHWKYRIVSDSEIINYANDIVRKLSSNENFGISKCDTFIYKIIKLFKNGKQSKIKKHQTSFPATMPGTDRFGDIQFISSRKDSKSQTGIYKKDK